MFNFATVCLPLTILLRKDTKFQWNEEQEKCFLNIKKYLSSEPVLKLPDFSKQFIVTTNASQQGLSAILTQDFEGKEHVISFASRVTNIYEKNYSTCELEGLAIIFALKVFRCYLLGVKFTIFTENNALIYI
jgi:hypothetical protein